MPHLVCRTASTPALPPLPRLPPPPPPDPLPPGSRELARLCTNLSTPPRPAYSAKRPSINSAGGGGVLGDMGRRGEVGPQRPRYGVLVVGLFDTSPAVLPEVALNSAADCVACVFGGISPILPHGFSMSGRCDGSPSGEIRGEGGEVEGTTWIGWVFAV